MDQIEIYTGELPENLDFEKLGNEVKDAFENPEEAADKVFDFAKRKSSDIYQWLVRMACMTICGAKSRKIPVIINAVNSSLVIGIGITVGVSAYLYSEDPFMDELSVLRVYKVLVSQVMLLLACMVFVVGMCGLATIKISNRIFLAAFGSGMTVMTIGLATCTSIFMFFKDIDDKTMQSFCTGSTSEPDQ